MPESWIGWALIAGMAAGFVLLLVGMRKNLPRARSLSIRSNGRVQLGTDETKQDLSLDAFGEVRREGQQIVIAHADGDAPGWPLVVDLSLYPEAARAHMETVLMRAGSRAEQARGEAPDTLRSLRMPKSRST